MVVDNLEFHIKRTGDAAGQSMSGLSNSLKKLKKSSEAATGGLGKLLGSLKRIAFYRVIRTIIREISKAFDEGLKNAYKFSSTVSGELAKVMDVVASLGMQMKNQLGAALGELLINISPAIEAVENLIIRLADAMSRLFAVLGGRSTYTKAVASTEKWADATEAGAAAAKEWKNQLMGFDEINKLNDNSGNGGGSGKKADSTGNWELSPANFEWAKQLRDITMDWMASLNFEPLINAWGRLKSSVQDFVSLVDGALYWAYTNVLLPLAGWTIEKGLPVTITLLAAALGVFNSVVEKLSPVFQKLWEDILKPFGQWAGEVFINIVEHLTNTFESLSEKIESANSFGEFLQSLDGEETVLVSIALAIGLIVSKLVLLKTFSGVFDIIKLGITALTSPLGLAIIGLTALVGVGILLYNKFESVREKFDEVGKKFSEFKERFKEPEYWGELGTAIVEALSTAIGAAIGAVADVGKKIGEKILQGLKDFFFGDTWGEEFLIGGEGSGLRKIGESIMEGIQGGIQAKIDAIKTWIDKHIKEPFLKGFREAFGIHSPAEETKFVGEAIFDGIGEGIINKIKDIFIWITDNVFKPIKDAFMSIFGIASDGENASTFLSIGTSIIEGIKKGIDNAWKIVTEFVSDHIWKPLKEAVLSVFGIGATGSNAEGMLTFGTSVISGLKQGIIDAWEDVKSFVTTKVWDKLKVAIRSAFGISSDGSDADNIKTYGTSLISGLKTGIKNAWSDVGSWFNTYVFTPLANEFDSLMASVNSWADSIQSVWNTVKETAKKIEDKYNEHAQKIWDSGEIWNGMNFASGGWPDQGELFISREAGPELVGTIGGRTAVVNNQDIVAAVSQGVATAVANVMGNSRGTKSVTLNVNGKEFARAIYNDMKSVTNEKGISLVNA